MRGKLTFAHLASHASPSLVHPSADPQPSLFSLRMSLEASAAYTTAHTVLASSPGTMKSPIQTEYDIIILGGGSAGCLLANRLSRDGKYSVLLVEAGESSLKVLFSYLPGAYGQMFHNERWDYNYFTVPQKGCHGRKMFQPRTLPPPSFAYLFLSFPSVGGRRCWMLMVGGKMLGGCRYLPFSCKFMMG